MGNDIASWRMSIGLFYGAIYGMVTKSYIGKISLNFLFLLNVLLYLKKLIWALGMNIYDSIYNIETASVVWLLLLMSGDIESNPGPVNLREHSVSVLHCNIRSIRNKLIDNFCDFECLCFTETHLDNNIANADICLKKDFSIPYRKDRTNHGGGILVYINNNLLHKRRSDLEVFWEESLWVEIKIINQQYLLGTFYSPKPQDPHFLKHWTEISKRQWKLAKRLFYLVI